MVDIPRAPSPPGAPAEGHDSGQRARLARRAEPRALVALAAAGCTLGVLGALAISGDNAGLDDTLNRWPGVVLSAAVVAAGLALTSRARSGPLATAGTTAFALGVPSLMFFVTLSDTRMPPFSMEAILVVSTAAWLGAWALGPPQGRPLLLGAGLVGAWATVLEVVEGVLSATFAFIDTLGDPFAPDPFNGVFDAPSPGTIGVLSLLFGVGYLPLARWFDRSGRQGAGTPCTAAMLPILAVAVSALADDLGVAGTGLLLLVLGSVLGWHGATLGRRATTWVGAAGFALGAALLLGDMADDVTIIGLLYLAAGIAIVAAAHALATSLAEPDEMAPGRSTFGSDRGPAAGAVPDGTAAPRPDPPGPPGPPTGGAPPGPPGPPPGSF